jgi:hypothetical protein
MVTPTDDAGGPAPITACSMVPDSTVASPTTPNSAAISNARLNGPTGSTAARHARRLEVVGDR